VHIFLTVLHVFVCVVLIVVVLLQRGKGAEIGAVFGGGASSTVFGSRGAGNFLTKLTTVSAVLFMVTSLGLSYLGSSRSTGGLFDDEPVPAAEEPSPFQESGAPVTPSAEAPAGEAPAAAAAAPTAPESAAPAPDATPKPETAPAP
jgi:preprotein translocase subunit SecG